MMSGPKVQIYKLKGKERENALAQLRCDREAARYFNASKEMLKKLSDSEAEIRISLQILKRMQEKYGSQEEKIAEAEKTAAELKANLSELKKLFSKYRPAGRRYVFTEAELQKKQAKLKQIREIHDGLQELKKHADKAASCGMDAVETKRSEILSLLSETLNTEEVPAETAEQLHQRISDFYAGFSGNLFAEGEEEHFAEVKAALAQSLKKYSPEVLSKDTYRELANALRYMQRIETHAQLQSFQSITLSPLKKKAEQESAHYEGKLAEWKALCELLSEERKAPAFDDMDKACEALEKEVLEQQEKEYIARCTDEVMKEMGYDLIGARQVVKKSGRHFRSELYTFTEGTAVNVTYSDDGQIAVEIGGISQDDRLPDAGESAVLVDAMAEFCSEFAVFEKKMAERGILVSSRIAKLPPAPEHASLININDYQMNRSVSLLEDTCTGKENGTQNYLYREDD